MRAPMRMLQCGCEPGESLANPLQVRRKEQSCVISGCAGPGTWRTAETAAPAVRGKKIRISPLARKIARQMGVPPYIVFTDKTLIDMCVKRPKNKSEMLEVSGVGESKYRRYGGRFLEEIKDAGEA